MSAEAVGVGAPRSRAELDRLARVLAAAFLDDPIWVAIGPRGRRHRALSNRASFWGIVHASRLHGGRLRVARLDGGEGPLAGGTIAFEPGHWPPPEWAAAWELPWALVAGPGPAAKGLRDERAMREVHVTHPHMYLWFIGVDPDLHSGGVGRALMAELHADSERLGVPTYLETGTERNLRFYRSLGYSPLGELELPSGPRMWRLERPPGG